MENRKKSQSKPNRLDRWSAPQQEISAIVTEILRLSGIHSCSAARLTPGGRDVLPDIDVESFGSLYLEGEILSKFDDGLSSAAKADEAFRKFDVAEEQCRVTNERLRADSVGTGFNSRTDVQKILWSAAWKIQSLLGAFSWDEAEQYFGWGPGATTRLSRGKSHPAYKYSGKPDTTLGNAALACAAVLRSPLWSREVELSLESPLGLNFVLGNRIVTVPKNYKTDRVIAIEPDLNMYVQKGLGGILRRRLRRVGVDLDDQSRNQRLARIGSISGRLATIDLSMASDTISREIVRLLLPPDWYEALDMCRSHIGTLPSGRNVIYQKFSSMGNGFTFELESLIFWAICSAVLDFRGAEERRLAVYGDDLIIDTASVPLLFEVLSYSGFTPNQKKSHFSGSFRESCGKHYILGYDVSPFYIKRPVLKLTDLFLLHNNFYRWCERRAAFDDISRYWPVIKAIRGLAPSVWRKPRIPDGFGDGAFIGSFDECTPKRAPNGLEGFIVSHLAPVAKLDQSTIPSGYLINSIESAKGSPLGWLRSDRSTNLVELVKNEPSYSDVGQCVGGISLPPRVREVKSLVRQFSPSPFHG